MNPNLGLHKGKKALCTGIDFSKAKWILQVPELLLQSMNAESNTDFFFNSIVTLLKFLKKLRNFPILGM